MYQRRHTLDKYSGRPFSPSTLNYAMELNLHTNTHDDYYEHEVDTIVVLSPKDGKRVRLAARENHMTIIHRS